MGYAISTTGFKGPYLPESSAADGSANLGQFMNLYCTKKQLAKLHDKQRAAGGAASTTASTPRLLRLL
jgi:hypothetical protein